LNHKNILFLSQKFYKQKTTSMKKLVLAFMGMAFFSAVNAQHSFGIHVNGIMSNYNGEYKEGNITIKQDGKYKASWKAGVAANLLLIDNFVFMPQLNVLNKGAKLEQSGTETVMGVPYTYNVNGKADYTYLEMPLYFMYSSDGELGGFFAGLGPVLSYGLSGKEKATTSINFGGTTQSETYDNKVKFDGKKDANDEFSHYKAFEFGGGLIAGYKAASGLFVNAHFHQGFTNISPDTDTQSKNRYFGVGIGYFFGGGATMKK
jgi:hypothetical protein